VKNPRQPLNIANIKDFFSSVKSEALSFNVSEFYGEVLDYSETILGGIYFRIIGLQNRNAEFITTFPIATPKNPMQYTLPIPGNLVLIEATQDAYYYTNIFSKTGNENTDFLINFESSIFSETIDKQSNAQLDVKGFIIKEVIPINLKPGDTVLKGTQNNNIVLSYDVDGNPTISIILNRADANYDSNTNGIHLFGAFTSDKEYDIGVKIKANFPSDEYDIQTIIVNSDSIRLNSKNKSITFTSNRNINFIMNSDMNIDCANIFANSNKIYLGKNANESLVLGNKLKD